MMGGLQTEPWLMTTWQIINVCPSGMARDLKKFLGNYGLPLGLILGH
jgi:hypothetical protein